MSLPEAVRMDGKDFENSQYLEVESQIRGSRCHKGASHFSRRHKPTNQTKRQTSSRRDESPTPRNPWTTQGLHG